MRPALHPSYSFFRFFLMSCLLATTMAVSNASAQSTNPAGTGINTANTFYAYVEAGENLDIGFSKLGNFGGATDAQITVRGPDGVVETCTALESGVLGSGCSWSGLNAATTGVWQIDFQPDGQLSDWYEWTIDVQGGTGSIDGRVYSELYGMRQAGSATADFSFWYQSEQGFLYETTYTGYHGISSGFGADATGNAHIGTCVSAYESMDDGTPAAGQPNGDADRLWTPIFEGTPGQCGDPYKIFFENPDPNLPETAQLWDGSTTVWLDPDVALPNLDNLAFTPNSTTVRSGNFTFDVSNFTGQLQILVDVNDDGDYTDPEDRVVPVAVTQDGTVTVAFDGQDGQGNPIPATQDLNARVAITQAGEIHFVNGDVETRSGLTVEALNGPDNGSTTIYWNDTDLVTADREGTIPSPLDGTGGENSSGGAHGWDCSPMITCNANDGNNGGWGDARRIDDWTYHSINEFEEIEIPGEPVDIELTGGPCWRMLSSPVQGLTYADMLDSLWTQGSAGSDYPGGEPNIFLWPNGQAGNDPSGWQPLGDLNQVIPPGTGFLISVYADDDFDGNPDPFPKTLSVSGPAHTGDITPPMNTNSDGWTLVGNPYTQPVDFSSLGKTALTDVGYVYDRDTGTWASTTSDGYGDVTDGAFATGQGFFVQNDSTSTNTPSLTFSETDTTTGGEFYGKQRDLRDYLRLEVRGESLYNSMWIRFSDEGSMDPASGDALELQPLADQYALLGVRKTDGTLFDIGHFPLREDDNLEIPVHMEATQNGSYTITATDLDLPAATELYLHDLETGKTIPITDSFDYTFTMNQSAKSTPDTEGITPCSATPRKAKTTGSHRFVITTSPSADGPAGEVPDEVALGQNYPNPFNPSTQISYQLPQTSEVRLEVFDMLGRRVAILVEGTVEAGVHQVNFNAGHLSSGIYLYRLATDKQVFTRKLTLIK